MENPISGDERRAQEVLELTDDSESTSANNDGGEANEDMEGTGEDDDEMDEDASSSLSAGDDLIVRPILSTLFFSNNILAGRLGRCVRW